jgi:hypothetical protein
MLIDSQLEVLFVFAIGAFCYHGIHARRMPSLYAKKLQSESQRYHIPPWVFYYAWLTVLTCDIAFGVLFFFKNTTYDIYYNLNFFFFFTLIPLMMTWNVNYFDVVCFYAVGVIGAMIGIWHALILIFTILYGNQSWFVYLILAFPIAWSGLAGIWSMIMFFKLGPKLKLIKKEVAEEMNQFESTLKKDTETPSSKPESESESVPAPIPTSTSRKPRGFYD